MKNRLISLLTAAAMLFSLFATLPFAANAEDTGIWYFPKTAG